MILGNSGAKDIILGASEWVHGYPNTLVGPIVKYNSTRPHLLPPPPHTPKISTYSPLKQPLSTNFFLA